jgi:ferrochelatase
MDSADKKTEKTPSDSLDNAKMAKKGILLVNLGTPDAPTYGAVRRYLKEFLLDARVIDVNPILRNILVRGIIAPFRSRPVSKAYKELWMEEGSPLKVYGMRLKSLLQEKLGDHYFVDLAMRYQQPSMKSVINNMLAKNLDEILLVPLFPQYASATTGSVFEEAMRIFSKSLVYPKISFLNSYYNHPAYINAQIERSKEYDLKAYDHILFSYHGLPVRQLKNADQFNHCEKVENCCATLCEKNKQCYGAQCYGTTKAIVDALGIEEGRYSICFQSRLGRAEWKQPYTSDVLKERADKGDKRILCFSPAFVADCLETTIEIAEEYQEEFEEMGGERIDLVASLNDSPHWIDALAQIILEQ